METRAHAALPSSTSQRSITTTSQPSHHPTTSPRTQDDYQALVADSTPQMQQDIKMVNILTAEVAKMHADTQEVRRARGGLGGPRPLPL